jgi:hypothetical protein
VRMSGGSTAFYLLPFVVTASAPSKSNTGMGFRHRGGWPGPKGLPKGAGTPVEIKKSKSRAGGTAGAAPKTTTASWRLTLP